MYNIIQETVLIESYAAFCRNSTQDRLVFIAKSKAFCDVYNYKKNITKTMKKAIIFDLDGTLANTIGDVALAGNAALSKLKLLPIEENEYKKFVGDGAKKLCERMLKYRNAFDEKTAEKLLSSYLSLYLKYEGTTLRPFGGMKNTLETLKEKGIMLFVLSNKPKINVVDALEILYRNVAFSEIIGGDGGFPLKPDPTSLRYLMKKYSLTKSEVLYVGDGDADFLASKNADIPCLSCLWGYRKKTELEKLGASCFIDKPSDILKYID